MPPDKHERPWTVQAAALSDVGLIRKQNEDRYLVDPKHLLFIVSDGIGGRNAGAVAAEIVVTALPALLEQRIGGLKAAELVSSRIVSILSESIRELSHRLFTESQGRVGLQGMGATVALIWCYRDTAYLAHMGDSRIYLLRNNQLAQVTQDHTVLELLRRRQEISPEEARNHPARGRLARYVGMDGEVYPHVQKMVLYADDRLLICSDGLSNMVPDTAIAQILGERPAPAEACAALIEAAKGGGGADNITALVIHCALDDQRLPKQSLQQLQPQEKKESRETDHVQVDVEQERHTGQSREARKERRMQVEVGVDEEQTEIT